MKAGLLHLLEACSHQQQGLSEAAIQTVTQAVLTFHWPHSLTRVKLYMHTVIRQALSVVMSGCLYHVAQKSKVVTPPHQGNIHQPRETARSSQAPSPVNCHSMRGYERVSTSRAAVELFAWACSAHTLRCIYLCIQHIRHQLLWYVLTVPVASEPHRVFTQKLSQYIAGCIGHEQTV